MPARTGDTISTTQLARNLSAAIDQVRIQDRALAITKGKRTVAQLEPPPRQGYPVTELAPFLEQLPHLGENAASFVDDLDRVRGHSSLPVSPWDS